MAEKHPKESGQAKKPSPMNVEQRLGEGLTLLIEGYLARSRARDDHLPT